MKKMILALVVFIMIMGAPLGALAENDTETKARPDRVTEIRVAKMQALYVRTLHKETSYKLIKQRTTWNDDCSELRWYLLAYNCDLQSEESSFVYGHTSEVDDLERALWLTYYL